MLNQIDSIVNFASRSSVEKNAISTRFAVLDAQLSKLLQLQQRSRDNVRCVED